MTIDDRDFVINWTVKQLLALQYLEGNEDSYYISEKGKEIANQYQQTIPFDKRLLLLLLHFELFQNIDWKDLSSQT